MTPALDSCLSLAPSRHAFQRSCFRLASDRETSGQAAHLIAGGSGDCSLSPPAASAPARSHTIKFSHLPISTLFLPRMGPPHFQTALCHSLGCIYPANLSNPRHSLLPSSTHADFRIRLLWHTVLPPCPLTITTSASFTCRSGP